MEKRVITQTIVQAVYMDTEEDELRTPAATYPPSRWRNGLEPSMQPCQLHAGTTSGHALGTIGAHPASCLLIVFDMF
jgi:hypothetical protein